MIKVKLVTRWPLSLLDTIHIGIIRICDQRQIGCNYSFLTEQTQLTNQAIRYNLLWYDLDRCHFLLVLFNWCQLHITLKLQIVQCGYPDHLFILDKLLLKFNLFARSTLLICSLKLLELNVLSTWISYL